MIRGCRARIPRVLQSVASVKSGYAGIPVLGCGHGGSSQKSQYSSGQNHHNNSYWSSLGLGLVIGTSGLAYFMHRDENVAHCGSSDHWRSKINPPVLTSQQAASNESQGDEEVADEAEEEVVAQFPTHVPYLIIGAGTAAMAAYKTIRGKQSNAKVLLVGAEEYRPYMRPPLSKDMWFTERSLAQENKFNLRSGGQKSIFYDEESYYCQPSELATRDKGGVAVATGMKVVKLDAEKKKATLSDGTEVSYDRCLIATGGKPKNLRCLEKGGSQVMDKVTLFRGIDDFRKLDQVTDSKKSVIIIGGGFLGSELASCLGKKIAMNGLSVTQVIPQSGVMGRILPEYLSIWATNKLRAKRVTVKAGVRVEQSRLSDDGTEVEVLLSDGSELSAEHILVAVGIEPNTELAESAGLEVDDTLGGFLVNAELEAATDIWVAGDAACFYDVKFGRRRVEHHEHAAASGRLAGDNMTGASKKFLHQSMFWSGLGPDVAFEAVGLVDSQLPTVSVFAKTKMSDGSAETSSQTNDYAKGVIFYMKEKQVVGVVCWNMFNKIEVARKLIKEGAEHDDLSELAKMFDLPEGSFDHSSSR
ncbi:apoptosis-inducing factor 1, mitochondrial-like [Watersipora subatra]|uniref:apoptosis-inducing factor 1, mitochondrial-like n=1 Tax=Watersipora subatra TaxID=2589382 RepID=UPI00355B6B06